MFLKTLAGALLALSFAACTPAGRAKLEPVTGDAFMGPADARVTITEYGSPACPFCKNWHDTYWEEVKHDYIDTGKVKFVFREFAIHGAIDAAVFAIARCAGPNDFFGVIDAAFASQEAIVRGASKGGEEGKAELFKLGAQFQLSQDQVKTCLIDKTIIRRINDVRDDARTKGIDSTPTFMVNGTVLRENGWPAIKAVVDAALAAAPATEAPAAPAISETPAPASSTGPLHGPDEPH